MQRLDEIVTQYLEMDTSYALLITGEWGIGKTYYFKNTIKDKISEVPVYGNANKKYKPILVSLFGLKSIEEIQTEILLSLFPFLKKKGVKLGANIGKSLFKGILQFKNLINIYDYVAELNVDKGDWINFEDLVVCFDDLERISEDLKIEELIGYVNSLVENGNIKILLIANEDKLDKTNYSLLKEKVIGNTIVFNPSLDVTYDNIIKHKFEGSPVYKKFLEVNNTYILDTFTKKSTNLRILIFALNYFQNIFSTAEVNLFNEDGLKEIKDQILLNLLKFTLSISIEYKLEKINFKSRHEIDNPKALTAQQLMRNIWDNQHSDKEKSIKEKSYAETFMEEYYKNDKYYFYKTIYDYLTGGAILNASDLTEEIKATYHIEKKEILPQFEVYNKLLYNDCFSLTNKEYLELTKKALIYAYAGKYDLTMYLTIFHFATRFNNPLVLNLPTLESKLMKGMQKGVPNYVYNSFLRHQLTFSDDSEYKNHFNILRDEALRLNNNLQEKIKNAESLQLETLCYENFEEFYKRVLDNKQSVYYESIFSKFNPSKFYSFFYKSDSKTKWEIIRFFRSRNNTSNNHKEEITFYKKLKVNVSKQNLRGKGKNISGFIWSEFDTLLQNQIDLLSNL